MPLRKMSTPQHQKELRKKLVAAYQEQNLEQILTTVKDHLEEQENEAIFRETTDSNERLRIATPCMVFLVFDKFDCPVCF
ncbi:hypothetical protein NHJ6243_010185 [Beauveria neobassiana]